MPDDEYRILEVRDGKVPCIPGKDETVEHCRFCVHSRFFRIEGVYMKSPALAFCLRHRDANEVNMQKVEAVKCGDKRGEGYRSMMSIIG